MTLFKAPFLPAVNATGHAKLTFIGLDTKTGLTKVERRPYQINNLKFEVMGKVRGTSTYVNITSGTNFDIESPFCKALINMGINQQILLDIHLAMFGEADTIEDSDGFEVEDIPEDSDGFGIIEGQEYDFSEIEKFCLENNTNVFTGKVFQNDKKYWEIDAETIKPLTKPKTEKTEKTTKTGKKGKKSVETETEIVTETKPDPLTETQTEG